MLIKVVVYDQVKGKSPDIVVCFKFYQFAQQYHPILPFKNIENW